MAWLAGKKTYLVGLLMIAKVVIDYVLGNGIDFKFLLEALGLMGLRAGVAKV